MFSLPFNCYCMASQDEAEDDECDRVYAIQLPSDFSSKNLLLFVPSWGRGVELSRGVLSFSNVQMTW
ncbi:hypothetical protein CEXT_691271 [Caerostris extrusa]|uniref:Uncharacterized protein n=1 Tax=Caerostris extrusa TaxID=172846 RepID=A0AAV4XFR3_CAEEX|nr:hypothetical protein CEXT_691271 [Caerostris extrusa]